MLINNNIQLNEFCTELASCKTIAVDTEFSREATYFPKLCLIQIATNNKCAVIDVLNQDISLESLINVFKNEKIVKVFHSAKQDMEALLKQFNCLPSNVFDTQIAASFCGYGTSISYEFLVDEIFSVKLDKSLRISDWSKRPLSLAQIEYALGDVKYLLEIYQALSRKLTLNNRLNWALEDMNSINQANTYEKDVDKAWQKIKNPHHIKIDLVLKRLAAWREEKAQEYNLPRNHFMSEKSLIKLAKLKPIELAEIKDIDDLRKLSNEDRSKIIEISIKSMEDQINMDLNKANQPQINLIQLNHLKKLLIDISAQHAIPPEIIATQQEMRDFISNHNIKKIRFLHGWRFEVFGKNANEFLRKTNL